MTTDQKQQLSYFQRAADIDREHGVFLVQDVRNNKFYVQKFLTVYNAEIYRYLQAHPVANTPRILFAEEDSGVLTVIEEFIPGDTLEERLERSGVFPEKETVDIAIQLCTILSDFHNCSPAIVNRDIKPANIKLTPDGVVKLLDMNAAKWCSSGSVKDTVLLGTQGYAAPEQYGFGPSNILTDIYAVGVLMNVMLIGELPNCRMAGGKLGKIVRKCVELSPSARYQSAAELLDALNALSGRTAADPNASPAWRRFLPPGFRRKGVVKGLFAALGYGLLFWLGFSMEVENAGGLELALNRVTFVAAVLCVILFNGNYLNAHQSFILTRSRHRLVRWLGMIIVDVVILSLWIILMNLLVGWFVR